MLPTLPVRRKSAAWILGITAWNLLWSIPFMVSFFALTEKDKYDNDHASNYPEDIDDDNNNFSNDPTNDPTNEDNDNYQPCRSVPWHYSNFARWALLANCIYFLCTIPFNFIVLKARKHNKESRWTPWLTMFDMVVWAFNFGLFVFAIIALDNRQKCDDDDGLRNLIWCVVFIPSLFFGIMLFAALIALVLAVIKLQRQLKQRGYVKQPVQVVNAQAGQTQFVEQNPRIEVAETRATRAEPVLVETTNPGTTTQAVNPQRVEVVNVRNEAYNKQTNYETDPHPTVVNDIRSREPQGSRAHIA